VSDLVLSAAPVLAQLVWGRPGDPEVIVFAIAAVVALGAAIAVVTMRNIVHGALMLVVHFLAVAVLYLAAQSSFLAIVQVLVYAGAIMVLFLFVIMLLGVDRDDLLVPGGVRAPVAAAAASVLVAGLLVSVLVGPTTAPASVCGSGEVARGTDIACVGLDEVLVDDPAGVASIGRSLFTRHVLPFEIAGLLLTVASVGALILARRRDDGDDEERPGPEVADAGGAAVGSGAGDEEG
jgi:NADH-quinone oxidoreductase subunit J